MRILSPLAASVILICILSLTNPLRPAGWPDVVVAADANVPDVRYLSQLPKVGNVVTARQGQLTLHTRREAGVNTVMQATLIGIDQADLAEMRPPVSLVAGDWYRDAGQATVGSLVASTLGLRLGDSIQIGDRELTVAGVLARSMTQLDGAILLDFSDVPRDLPTYTYLFLKSQYQLEDVTDDLHSLGLRVETDPFYVGGEERKVLAVKIMVALLVAAFIIWHILKVGRMMQAKAQADARRLWWRYVVGLVAGTAVAAVVIYTLNAALQSIGFPLFRLTWLPVAIAYVVLLGSAVIGNVLNQFRETRL